MKKLALSTALLAWLLVGLAAPLAADQKEATKTEPKATTKVKELSGKQLYRQNCKLCHGPDAPAGEYSPMLLIQEQWERFFDETYPETHPALVDSVHGGKTLQEILDKNMLKKIRKFCIEGAADSEHPMTCG